MGRRLPCPVTRYAPNVSGRSAMPPLPHRLAESSRSRTARLPPTQCRPTCCCFCSALTHRRKPRPPLRPRLLPLPDPKLCSAGSGTSTASTGTTFSATENQTAQVPAGLKAAGTAACYSSSSTGKAAVKSLCHCIRFDTHVATQMGGPSRRATHRAAAGSKARVRRPDDPMLAEGV